MTVQFVSRDEKDLGRVIDVVQQLAAGRSNAIGTVTLASSTTVTTVSTSNCGSSSKVFLFPHTPNAAAALATTSITTTSISAGQFTITHANNTVSDRTFAYLTIG